MVDEDIGMFVIVEVFVVCVLDVVKDDKVGEIVGVVVMIVVVVVVWWMV